VAKTFEALLLAQGALRGELALDDPAAKHVPELQQGGDIRRLTLGQLASFTGGLLLKQDYPPWPTETFTQESYLARLNEWQLEKGRQPGKQVIHVQSGYILLRVALERRYRIPYGELMRQRVLEPLGLKSTTLPVSDPDTQSYPRGRMPDWVVARAVQGYDEDGTPIGKPGDLQGYYQWLGMGQMYSSARDMAEMVSAQLGEKPQLGLLHEAMQLTQRDVLPFGERWMGAMAWEKHLDGSGIVERYGGLNNASATMAMVPARKLGVVILCNRGSQNVGAAARAILLELSAL
jgi:beta-lactamase class C